MAQSIQFDLASPQKLHFSKPVSMVMVPGSEGMYGVLPGHALMDTGISMGVVEIYEVDQNTVTERFFVVGGFCEVTADYCTVMADQVVTMTSLKRDIIEAEIAQLNSQASNDDVAFQLTIAQAKLMAIS